MKKDQFVLNTVVFSIATFISRVLGYIRDAVIAFVFGANPLTDAFFVAWRLPNTLRQLVAEGSFNAAFVPVYTDERKNSQVSSKEFVSSMFTYYTLVLSVITFLVVVFADVIVRIIAPGFIDKGNFEETVNLIRIVFPYLILVGWVSFFMALLNVQNKFFIPAVSPALLNISFISSALFLSQYYGIYALAYGALIGGILQVILQIFFAYREGIRFRLSFKLHSKVKETFRRIVPAFGSFGVSQFAFIIDTVIASFLVGGAVSYLYYGNRIFQLPLGLFAIGLGNALLVSLSSYYSSKDMVNFHKDFNNGLKLALFISLPATVGMIVLGKEIIELLLMRGEFKESDVLMTYYALSGYAVGLAGYALTRPYKSAFFSIGDMKTPLNSTIVGLGVGVLFAVILGFFAGWGVFGLALASSLGGFAGLVYLMVKSRFTFFVSDFLISLVKIGFSSLVMGIAVYLLKEYFEGYLTVQVFGGIIIGIFVYIIILYLLKESSFQFFVKTVGKKIKY
ncbi:murein biosynthesis integral membrane protein MurJ [Persephonella sp.]